MLSEIFCFPIGPLINVHSVYFVVYVYVWVLYMFTVVCSMCVCCIFSVCLQAVYACGICICVYMYVIYSMGLLILCTAHI